MSVRKVWLFKKDGWWVLRYGVHGDCTCGFSSWQAAVGVLDHALAVTFGRGGRLKG
jgi:hypothetical protein